jgi:hypothetical protein
VIPVPKYGVEISDNIYYIWVKINECLERFVNFSSEYHVFSWAVTAPYLDHAKHLISYRHSKGPKPKVIHAKSENPISPSTPPYPTVAGSCGKLNVNFAIMGTARGHGRPLDCDLDDIIFTAVNELPFHRLRRLSRTLRRALSAICGHLARYGFVLKGLSRVSHKLCAEHKATRVELAS